LVNCNLVNLREIPGRSEVAPRHTQIRRKRLIRLGRVMETGCAANHVAHATSALESTPRAVADVEHFDQLLLLHDAEYRAVDVRLVAVE